MEEKNKYVLYITERKNRPLSGQNLTVLNVCSATSETLFCIYIKNPFSSDKDILDITAGKVTRK